MRALGPDGDVGRVWSSSRPLVYRALETLGERGLVRATRSEPSPRGPARTVLTPTAAGRRALGSWLDEPIDHVRDVRSALMLKLLLHDRSGSDPTPLLEQQAVILAELEQRALDLALEAVDFERTLALWRLSSTREARRFVADLVGTGSRAVIVYRPIGVVRSGHHELPGMPLQPAADTLGRATVEIDRPYRRALADLEGFSHLWVVAHLDRVVDWQPLVLPFLGDANRRGVFATRTPRRPNPISISLARIARVRRDRVELEGIDLLDDTPVLDLKPHVPHFDSAVDVRTGWFEGRAERIATVRSDDRFARDPEASGQRSRGAHRRA